MRPVNSLPLSTNWECAMCKSLQSGWNGRLSPIKMALFLEADHAEKTCLSFYGSSIPRWCGNGTRLLNSGGEHQRIG